jgi:hypothetical protein
VVGWLVRLYPRAWRERYEEEFVAMLEQGPVSIRDLFDVALDGRGRRRFDPRPTSLERRARSLSSVG